MTPPRKSGPILLTLSTLLWGTTFVITRHTLDTTTPAGVIFGRFAVAAVLLCPFLSRQKRVWIASIELGLLLLVGFATQTIGLRYTTVARSSFITSSCVVMVPIVAIAFGRVAPVRVWFAAMAAVVGLYLLCNDQSAPNRGDWWTLACAAAWGLYIVRLEKHAATLPTLALSTAQVWVVTASAVIWWLLDHSQAKPGPMPWLAVGYLGLFATAATTLLQAIGQRTVPAAQAAILFTMEPVWATLFARLIDGATIGRWGVAGGVIIFISAVMAQLPQRRRRKIEEAG